MCRGTRGGHPTPATLLLKLGWSNEDAVPTEGGPSRSRDVNEGCLQSQSANRRGPPHRNYRQIKIKGGIRPP